MMKGNLLDYTTSDKKFRLPRLQSITTAKSTILDKKIINGSDSN